jgi:hypothetical protein
MAVEYRFRGTTRKDRRKDRRVPVSLPAIADGVAAIIVNISFGGCAFVAEDADLELSDVITITLGGQTKIEATILRKWSRNHYAAAFGGLTPAAFRAIENLETGHARRHGGP